MTDDNAVALVRAYLHLNGYFTVTEFPAVEALRGGGYWALLHQAQSKDTASSVLLTLEKARRGTAVLDTPTPTLGKVRL